MNRKALLIGNTNNLPGVNIDIKNYRTFLLSDNGGVWFSHEIEVMKNPRKADVLNKIEELRNSSLDYCFVIFTGHGGQIRQETVLELNAQGETIEERYLKKIAPKQVNIFDCCRVELEWIRDSAAREDFSSIRKSYNKRIREMYERKIMSAADQQISLYACSPGESANDEDFGGVYSHFLLESANNIADRFKTFSQCHSEAARKSVSYCESRGLDVQHPTATLPRCLSSQELIMSINDSVDMWQMLGY